MKVFWKQFVAMMCFSIAVFMVFGNILVQTSFHMSLSREIRRGIAEMEMFQYVLLASLENLPDEYQATELAMAEIIQTIEKNTDSRQDGIVVYDHKRNVIYQDQDYQSSLMGEGQGGLSEIWQLTERGRRHYLETLCLLQGDFGSYYVGIEQDMEYIYGEREQLYVNYRIILLVFLFILTIFSLIFSLGLTQPVRRLSLATRAYAAGNYQSRVRVRGNDEVAVLMMDFNRMADQLEHNIVQLQESARNQKEFTAAFSHELKTPLTSIVGYADMLRSRRLSEEDAALSADYIFRQGKRLERLALQMQELIYLDRQEITLQEISVEDLVRDLRANTQMLLQEKDIHLRIRMEEGSIFGEMDLIQSLFLNLIDNARKACGEGGEIVLEGRRLPGAYQICVSDNGCGIPEDELPKITEPFYMVNKSRARRDGGVGMGMALCHRILMLHRAEWDISSTVGKGTSVSIIFHEDLRPGREEQGV